jgi:hypothetical protein
MERPEPPANLPELFARTGARRGLDPADDGECRIVPEEALDPIAPTRWGADAAACTREPGPGSVREFSLFEHGAGI